MIPAPNVPAAQRSGQDSPQIQNITQFGGLNEIPMHIYVTGIQVDAGDALRGHDEDRVTARAEIILVTPSILRSCCPERVTFTEWTVRHTLARECMLRRLPQRRKPMPASTLPRNGSKRDCVDRSGVSEITTSLRRSRWSRHSATSFHRKQNRQNKVTMRSLLSSQN